MQLRTALLATALVSLCCSKGREKSAPETDKPSNYVEPEKAEPEPVAQHEYYRVAVELGDAGEAPFYLELGSDNQGWLVNGSQKSPVTYSWTGADKRTLTVVFDKLSDSELRVTEGKGDELTGQWTSNAPALREYNFEATATKVGAANVGALFDLKGGADLSGEWKFTFEKAGPARARFRKVGAGGYEGTILTKGSDFGNLAGSSGAQELAMSYFDGLHAYVLRGELSEDGRSIEGKAFYWHLIADPFKASRLSDASYQPFDPLNVVQVKYGAKLTSEALADYADRPLILKIGGTWCTVCTQALPAYRSLDDKFKDRGLVHIDISIEFDEPEAATAKTERYKSMHGVPWDIVPIADMDDFHDKFPSLPDPQGFPTTVFVNKDGTIHAIHSGYVPSFATQEHAEQTKLFEKLADELVSAK